MSSLPGQIGESKGLTKAICSFVVETRSADIPPAALESAKLLILDTIGITLAASSLPIGKIITQYVADANGRRVATVLGGGLKATPSMAALANGTMANTLDFDGGWHTTTHVVPSALAVVEHQKLSGHDLLDAFVIGAEVGKRLTETFDTSRQVKATRAAKTSGPTARGHWHVGLAGPIATAAVAARLLKLSTEQTAMAIGIATCSAGGFRRNMGTMSKAFH
jgi:2-methylcitrate dehydratase PrpD